MTIRWTLTDTSTLETVTLTLNPDEASPPEVGRNLKFAWGSYWGTDRMRVMDRPPETPGVWTFGGVIRTKEHYDQLLEWCARDTILEVATHVNRTFEVLVQRFDPVERRPRATRPWLARYTITCMMLREIA